MALTIEMDAAEALYALAAIQSAGARAHHNRRMMMATNAPIDEYGIAETAARAYDRLERRLTDALYPDPRWEHRLDEAEIGVA